MVSNKERELLQMKNFIFTIVLSILATMWLIGVLNIVNYFCNWILSNNIRIIIVVSLALISIYTFLVKEISK